MNYTYKKIIVKVTRNKYVRFAKYGIPGALIYVVSFHFLGTYWFPTGITAFVLAQLLNAFFNFFIQKNYLFKKSKGKLGRRLKRHLFVAMLILGITTIGSFLLKIPVSVFISTENHKLFDWIILAILIVPKTYISTRCSEEVVFEQEMN